MKLYRMLSVGLVSLVIAAPAFAGSTAGNAAGSSRDSTTTKTPCAGDDCNSPSASPSPSVEPGRSSDQDVQAPRTLDRDSAGSETQAPRGTSPSNGSGTETQAPRGNTGQQPGGTMEKNGDLNDTARGNSGSMR